VHRRRRSPNCRGPYLPLEDGIKRKAKLASLDRRCAHLRREAAHQLTTELAGSYGHVVIEDLDVAAMKQGMGRRASRRAISDAAVGAIRPQLVYKTTRHGGSLTVADRWFASSQIHHGCALPDGSPCRLIGKQRIDKLLMCPPTGEMVDRVVNAARNLRDWPDMPVDAQSVRRPRSSAVPAAASETAAQTVDPINGQRSSRKTSRPRAAVNGEDKNRISATRCEGTSQEERLRMIDRDHTFATDYCGRYVRRSGFRW
jgi:putative transposase